MWFEEKTRKKGLLGCITLSAVTEIKVKSEIAFELSTRREENAHQIETHSIRALDPKEAQEWMEMIKPSRSSHGLVGMCCVQEPASI
eukprot:COSAG05_NODE_994_length_6264_cov_3.618329_4_plen_87_part_00